MKDLKIPKEVVSAFRYALAISDELITDYEIETALEAGLEAWPEKVNAVRNGPGWLEAYSVEKPNALILPLTAPDDHAPADVPDRLEMEKE